MSLTPVRGLVAPVRPTRPVAASVRVQATAPAPAEPRPVKVPAKAGSALLVNYYMVKAYQASKEHAAGYKASITLFGQALNEARLGVEAAQQALTRARAASAKADETAVVPYNAAKAAHAAAHARFQAPIDTLRQQLRRAWTELDHAVHPGRPTADARDGEAAQVRAKLESLDDQIGDRYDRLARLSPYAGTYASQATALRDEIRSLEAQQRPLFKQYVELSDKADAARGPQAGANDPKVKAAKAKVARLEAELSDAQATYRRETDKSLTAVDQAQQTYNRAMAEFRAGDAGAQRELASAQALFDEVQKAYDDRKPKMNVFKRLGWRLFHGVDVNKLWESERRKALAQPETK